ncbi:MAG: ATP-binding protein, partial [Bacteroidales bacterium]|nr:ATP-binding protein [Bacteroidales bacterium]
MTKNINPFVVTGKIPPQYFCDRIEESKQLEKALCNQMNVVLTSSRRMGKTSLVDFVFDKPTIKDNYITISIDILHTTTFREFILAFGTAVFDCVATRSEKWRKQFVTFLKSLGASFGYDAISNLPTFDIKIGDVQQPEYTLQEIFKYLESIDKRCLIVIDEFQQITYYPEKNVEALMRTHIQKMSNSNFVFSGSQRRLMEEMFFSSKRPFYQSAKSIRLEPIDK